MTESAEAVKARVRAALDEARKSMPVRSPDLYDIIEIALDEPKPTLRERVAQTIHDEWCGCDDDDHRGDYPHGIADAVLACIAEGALERTDTFELTEDYRKSLIADVLEVEPERIT